MVLLKEEEQNHLELQYEAQFPNHDSLFELSYDPNERTALHAYIEPGVSKKLLEYCNEEIWKGNIDRSIVN